MNDGGRLIPLTKGQHTIVDEDDFKRISKHKWHAAWDGTRYYAARTSVKNGVRKTVKMHRVVVGVNDRFVEVDHIDHDGLNNRKSNLRLCTHSQNMANQRPIKGHSKYRGVHWRKATKRWRAQVTKDQNLFHLGTFDSEEEAALAYNDAALELFGEYASLNKVEGAE